MIKFKQLKIYFVLLVLSLSAPYVKLINHNSISLALSIYILFLFPNTLATLKTVIFRASLLTTLSLFPALYFSFSPTSVIYVFATSFGIFSCLSLANPNFFNPLSRHQLYLAIEAILIFLGIAYFAALIFGFPIEQWRLLNIDTNGMGFYIFTLTICLYLIDSRFSPAFLTSVLFLAYRSNTYFIMIAVFIVFISSSIIIKRIVSLRFSRRFLLSLTFFIVLLSVLTVFLLEFERIINGFNLIFLSTGSIELVMQTDPRRYALTLQGIDLLNQLFNFFPFNLTGFGYSTFNYLQAVSRFSADFYLSSINVTQFAMDARPHNIYISLPATIGFPAAFILLFISFKYIFYFNYKIASASLAAVMFGLAFNEFISVPSIYLIFGLSYTSYQSSYTVLRKI